MDMLKFYIDGKWVAPVIPATIDVINPATEEVCATISAGSAEDANRAVMAARKAFASFSQTTKAERLALLKRILEVYDSRLDEMAEAISNEMGAPLIMAKSGKPEALAISKAVMRFCGKYTPVLSSPTLMYSPPLFGGWLCHVKPSAPRLWLRLVARVVQQDRTTDAPSSAFQQCHK